MAELAVPKCVRPAGVVVMITSVLVALSAAPAFAATVTQRTRDLGQCHTWIGAGGVDGRLDTRRREREL